MHVFRIIPALTCTFARGYAEGGAAMYIGDLYSLMPAVNFSHQFTTRPGDFWGPRIIPDYQLIYVCSGEMRLKLGGECYTINAGECAYYGPGDAHLLLTIKPSVICSLHFSWHTTHAEPVHPGYLIREAGEEDLLRKISPHQLAIGQNDQLHLPHHFALGGSAPSLLGKIEQQYRQLDDYAAPFALRSMLIELLLELIRAMADRSTSRQTSKVAPALQAMRDNPTRNWTVAQLAALCGYHPSYFASLFAELEGMSPKQYIISERIKLAKQALLKGEPIESISQQLGYTSIHYFSNNFKKETGLSPSEFRQMPRGAPQQE